MDKFLGFLGKFGGKVVDFTISVKDKAYELRLKIRKVKTRRELGAIAKNSPAVISESEVRAIEGLLRSHNLTAESVALPIKKVITIAAEDTITPKLMDELYKTEQKVFLVETDSDVTGLAILADIANLSADGKKVKKFMQPLPNEVPARTPLLKCLSTFAAENSAVLLVLDDKGKRAGLLRLEDVLKKLKLAEHSDPKA
jgi:CBS domain containing-hemolysin-like protein